MNKRIKNILTSLLVASTLSVSLIACGSNKQNDTTNNNTTNQTQTTTGDRNPGNRKPQASIPGQTSQDSTSDQQVYKDGEIVTLVDGSKIKYSSSGEHEILEEGTGKVLIFKTLTDSDLESLTDEQKAQVKRQMESEPNGFTVIY